MDGRENSGSYLRLKNLAAFARHTKCRTKDSLGCSGTETNEDFWPNNSHLCFEPWTAGCNFTWARFFVNPAFPTWFPLEMFNGICDVDFITSDACFFQRPIENVEDQEVGGADEGGELLPEDVAVGLTASGRTPYVIGALRAARARGARTILMSANPGASFGTEVDVHVGVGTGPEVIAGSTRMKAGTAQKLVLNTISTVTMIRLGRTFGNLMVDVVASNAKLRKRSRRAVALATGATDERAGAALEQADGDAKVAIVALLGGVDSEAARQRLERAGGAVRRALDDA